MKHKRIIVKVKDAEEKLQSATTFFDAMLFGIVEGRDNAGLVYCKSYYFTLAEGNLFERHKIILKSIPIKFTVEIFGGGKLPSIFKF